LIIGSIKFVSLKMLQEILDAKRLKHLQIVSLAKD
jgi:hypothetical protein